MCTQLEWLELQTAILDNEDFPDYEPDAEVNLHLCSDGVNMYAEVACRGETYAVRNFSIAGKDATMEAVMRFVRAAMVRHPRSPRA